MAHRFPNSSRFRPGNVGLTERWVSLAAGLGLTLLGARRGGFLRRALMSSAGLSLLSRGATGFCPMKASMSGETTLREGMNEQWSRIREAITARAAGGDTAAGAIHSLDSMFVAELQELHSAEAQVASLLERLSEIISNVNLQHRLNGYATELRSREQDLERILTARGANPRQHPDQAMQALVQETHKMAQVAGESVRDAALVASLQRLIHYKIAGYGTVAAYAKALGMTDDAARFADHADRDKAVDAELSELAKGTLNPQARAESEGGLQPGGAAAPGMDTSAGMEQRPH